jgi:hypothetical protein
MADEFILQLMTFLRSLDLFLELIALAPRTLTANQVRHGGKQGTDDPEHSRIHSSTLPSIDFATAELSGPKITISLTSRSFWSGIYKLDHIATRTGSEMTLALSARAGCALPGDLVERSHRSRVTELKRRPSSRWKLALASQRFGDNRRRALASASGRHQRAGA